MRWRSVMNVVACEFVYIFGFALYWSRYIFVIFTSNAVISLLKFTFDVTTLALTFVIFPSNYAWIALTSLFNTFSWNSTILLLTHFSLTQNKKSNYILIVCVIKKKIFFSKSRVICILFFFCHKP